MGLAWISDRQVKGPEFLPPWGSKPGLFLWSKQDYSVASPGFVAGALTSWPASFLAASPVAFDIGAVELMLATVIGSGVSAFAETELLWKSQALAATIEKPRLAATTRRVLMRFVLRSCGD
jgi:hypothetical protein